jgi:lipopolysaccharide export system permease protein
MLKIDRYLLRQFLWVFTIFFCSFLGLYVVADSVNNFEEFSTYARDHGGLLKVIGEYYGYRAFAFFDQISPLLILIAAMFTLAAFRRHNEMTVLLAAGISKARIARPIIVTAVLFALLAVANREVIIPSIREELNFKAQDLIRGTRPLQPTYDNQTDVLLGGEGIIRREQKIVRPNFFLPRSLDHYGPQIVARQAVYKPARSGRPGGYLLRKVEQPAGLAERPSLPPGSEPIVITPRDADWLKSDECFLVSGVDFQRLADGDTLRKFASTPELIAGLGNPSVKHGANVRVKIHARLVKPFLDVTLLFLGLPLVLSRQTLNLFVSVGLCVLLVVVYMLGVVGCHYLGGNATISASLAAWLPLMIFLPLAVGVSEPLRE